MADNSIICFKKEHVFHIILNRPEVGNIIDPGMVQKLSELSREINLDQDVNVVVLSGAKGSFCSGYSPEVVKALVDPGWPEQDTPAESLARINCPTIAVVRGDAFGGGLEMALACDLRIASDKVRFSLPQIQTGLIPTDGGTQRLSRAIGKGKALELILTGETVDARSALEIGLINKVVNEADLDSEADNLSRTIALKAPLALRYCKEAVNQGMELTLEQGLRLEADLYFLLHTTSDRTEGIHSFLEKRAPKYQGK